MKRLLLALSALSALAGCLSPAATTCSDGTVCPAEMVCLTSGGCALPAQVTACDGHGEGDACTFAGGVGRCIGGVCVGELCGNGIIDAGEICDGPAGVADGQTCSPTCTKLEQCGDGFVDSREACDDGNQNPADGCDACTLTGWSASALIGGNVTAATVPLNFPHKIAFDRYNNLYIAEPDGHRVRRVDPDGVVSTIAGTGVQGYGGDGGVATSAALSYPHGVAVDGLGNVLIADSGNNRIRRVDPSGVITTIAGTGVAGYLGDGGDARNAQLRSPVDIVIAGLGDVYVAEDANNVIRHIAVDGTISTFAGTGIGGFSGDGGPATSAQLFRPDALAFDGSNLYIGDLLNYRVRRVSASGVITTIAGTGVSGFSGDNGPATSAQLSPPAAIALDSAGSLYIADNTNGRVRRVASNGTITTFAGNGTFGFAGDGGPATSAELGGVNGLTIATGGALYIADTSNGRIRRVDGSGTIDTVAGAGAVGSFGDLGAATSAEISNIQAIAIDAQGAVYVADPSAARVRKIDAGGVITTVAGNGITGNTGDGGPATSATLDGPTALAFDSAGRLYIGCSGSLRRVDTNGIITTIAGTGAFGFSGDGGPATSAQLSIAWGIAIDATGNVYFSDRSNYRVRRIATTGVITTFAGTGTAGSTGDGGQATTARLNLPEGLALDSSGNLYIADSLNHRVRRVAPTNVITTFAGTGTAGFSGDGAAATAARLNLPRSVAIDANGTVVIADTTNQRIRRVSTAGTISTFAGTGTSGMGGDGGAAIAAQLDTPIAVTTGGGAVFIADRQNRRARRVDGAGIITTVAGSVDPEGMGPLSQAHLVDPRALVVAGQTTFFAGGSSGRLQRASNQWLDVVAGRYPQPAPIGVLARYRDTSFGSVTGVAYDAATQKIYLAETSAHRLQAVTVVDPNDETTWTIAPLANASGTAGFADGAAATARFREPAGLYLDAPNQKLYIADAGNHVIRALDLTTNTVSTVAGTPATRGFGGDGGAATAALLYLPQAITRCPNGDLMIADTNNHRVRRVAATDNTITTVAGVGVATSSGDGAPASALPVQSPLGVACDALGNVFVTSTTTVRLLPANDAGVVDGSGSVETIYGAPPRTTFPESVTSCLTGIAIVGATSVQMTDSCSGLLVELRRAPL